MSNLENNPEVWRDFQQPSLPLQQILEVFFSHLQAASIHHRYRTNRFHLAHGLIFLQLALNLVASDPNFAHKSQIHTTTQQANLQL